MKTRRVDPANTTPDSFGDLPLFAQGPTQLDHALANVSKAVKPPVPAAVKEAGRILSMHKRGLPVPENITPAGTIVESALHMLAQHDEAEMVATRLYSPMNNRPFGDSQCGLNKAALCPPILTNSPFHPPGGTFKGTVEITPDGIKFTPTIASAEALTSISSGLPKLEAIVFAAIKVEQEYGLIVDEIEQKTGLSHQTASARVNGLMNKNKIRPAVNDDGDAIKRKTRSGRNAVVWVVVE